MSTGIGECDAEGRGYLKDLSEIFGMTPLKIRILLITAEAYKTEIRLWVNELHQEGKFIAQIRSITGLNCASVHGYLPYIKIIFLRIVQKALCTGMNRALL